MFGTLIVVPYCLYWKNCTIIPPYCFVIVIVDSYCVIRYFRERSPAIFLRPQNITKHTLYDILALYSLITDAGIKLSCLVVIIIVMKNWLICNRCASSFFHTKRLNEDPYLKSFISRVRLFLSLLCDAGTIAVKPRASLFVIVVDIIRA